MKQLFFGAMLAFALPASAEVINTHTSSGEDCRGLSYAGGFGTTTLQLGSSVGYPNFPRLPGSCARETTGLFWVGPSQRQTFMEFSEGFGYQQSLPMLPASAGWSVAGVAYANCYPNCFPTLRTVAVTTPSSYGFRVWSSASRSAYDSSEAVVRITVRVYELVPDVDPRVPAEKRYLTITGEEVSATVPEPSNLALAAGALALLVWLRKGEPRQ